MGLYYLFGLCFAFFSVSALGALPSTAYELDLINQRYSFNNSSVSTPLNVRAFAANDPRIITKTSQGLNQSAGGRLSVGVPSGKPVINAPFRGSFNVSTPILKNAAKGFARSLPYLGTALLAVEGIDYVIENTEWFLDDDGILVKAVGSGDWLPSDLEIVNGYPSSFPSDWPNNLGYYDIGRKRSTVFYSSGVQGPAPSHSQYDVGEVAACSEFSGAQFYGAISCIVLGQYVLDEPNYSRTTYSTAVTFSHYGEPERSPVFASLRNDWFDPAWSNYGRVWAVPSEGEGQEFLAVTNAELDSAIDSFYDPFVSDWPDLFPFISSPEMVVIEPLDSIALGPVVSSQTQGDSVVVTEVTPSYDFAVSPSTPAVPIPSVSVDYLEDVKTYIDGLLESSSQTQTSFSPSPSVSTPPSSDSPFELPSFCSWAGPLCEWLDWTREPLDDDIDLTQIINDDDFERSYSIDFGSNVCPEPVSIDIAYLDKTIELSYQPACDLMGYARPFVLISAYLFAIYIGLGVVRNG